MLLKSFRKILCGKFAARFIGKIEKIRTGNGYGNFTESFEKDLELAIKYGRVNETRLKNMIE